MADTLQSWVDKVSSAIDGVLELHGQHYRIKGFDIPLSVTELEGKILFTVARVLRPSHILEIGTGTGYSTAWLAGGWPEAELTTVDNYTEGNTGYQGMDAAKAILEKVGAIESVTMLRADFHKMMVEQFRPDLIFADGIVSRTILDVMPEDRPETVVVLHDVTNADFIREPCFVLNTPSCLGVYCRDDGVLGSLRGVCSLFAPVMEPGG